MKKKSVFGVIALLAVGLVLVGCSGKKNSSVSGSGGTTTESRASGGNTPSGSNEKPKVEGIFGAFGLTDKDVTPKGSTLTLDAVYTKLNDSHIQATALFDGWNDAAGRAAYPGYIADVMKAIAKADDYGRPSVNTKDGTPTLHPKTYDEMVSEGLLPTEANVDAGKTIQASWECSFTFSGESVRFTVSVLGAQYQITAYIQR